MLRITLASLRAHAGRLVTTALAIVLGVMFVTGTLVFSGTLDDALGAQVKGSTEEYSVIVHTERTAEEKQPELPRETLDDIESLPEVGSAAGIVHGEASLLGEEGQAVGSLPTAGLSTSEDTRHSTAAEGKLPTGPDEAALATSSADVTGFGVGDEVTVLDAEGREHTFTVTGLLDLGVDPEFSYRGAVAFTEDTAHAMTGIDGYGEIDVTGASGYTDEEVRDAVAEVAPGDAEVLTGAELGARLAESAGAETELITTGLMLAGAVSVVVAGIVISNTFAILLAQRQREMALLRCVGAGRGQVLRSVLLEASLVGLVSSAVGVLTGIGVGYAGVTLGAEVLGAGDSATSLVVGPAAVAAGLVVGTGATVVAALVPAVRAARIPPLAALRDSAAQGAARGTSTGRVVLGTVLGLASAGIATWAVRSLENEQALIAVVAAGVVAFAGVVALGPLLVRALVAMARRPMRKLGVVSGLAADNSGRSPKRAATAMIALTVGATLITGYSVISDSTEETLTHELDKRFPVDYEIGSQLSFDGPREGVDPEVARELADSSDVAQVMRVRDSGIESGIESEGPSVKAYFGGEVGTDVTASVASGDLADLEPGRVVVHEDAAEGNGVGDEIAVETEEGEQTFEIAAVTEGNTGLMGVTMHPDDFRTHFPEVTQDQSVRVQGSEDVPADELRDTVMAAVADHPKLQVTSAVQRQQEYTEILDTLLLVVTAMLALSVLIAVAGVANTMALSVLERVRESAMLRALGLTRGQIRRMLGLEAVMLSLIGTGIGIALGIVFGWAAGVALLDGLILSIPVPRIAVFLTAAVLAGLLASVLPARRAARTSITRSLASE
ncbi:putative ABC transport system permease protein [Lipingzhangella halophila]|uniref:Putative ABC transport system permease protein n=1 Tax=Lipingzhangella halophila TaxID=1783352 RepID=A0A7W7RK58_9ACTN|nr:FtsX-like permease family protein [Lipingzhangella halophila]MBB4933499.1 putative ABC transport system permease protein [Lipingzhangella halophila]